MRGLEKKFTFISTNGIFLGETWGKFYWKFTYDRKMYGLNKQNMWTLKETKIEQCLPTLLLWSIIGDLPVNRAITCKN